jgi:hypothetical protein
MAKDYVFTPPPNWPAPPRGWTPPPGWTPDPEWGPAPGGWEFWSTQPSGSAWITRHPVASGVTATAVVLGAVIGVAAFASGPDNPSPTAAVTSSGTLTALDDTATDPTSVPETTLSSTTSAPTTSTADPSSSSPTPTSRTTSTSPSPTSSSPSATPSPTRTVRVYLSCSGMHRDHPRGVGVPGAVDTPRPGRRPVTDFEINARLYFANQGLDRDGDQIACER